MRISQSSASIHRAFSVLTLAQPVGSLMKTMSNSKSKTTSKEKSCGDAAATTEELAAGIAANGDGAPVVLTPVTSGSEATLSVPADRQEREARALELRDQLGDLARNSARTVVALGEILSSLKKDVGYGKWEAYTQNTLGIPPRTASEYMAFSRKISKRGGIEKVLNSGNAADLAVKDLKALLQHSGDSGGETSQIPGKTRAAPVRFADGSSMDLMDFGWKEGLIPKATLDTWIEGIVPYDDDDKEGNRKIARRQRVVAAFAATVNRVVGRAAPEVARDLVKSGVLDLLELINPQAPGKEIVA